MLADHAYRCTGWQVVPGHQPEAIAGFDLAMPGDYRLMQGEGASEQFAAALVKPVLVTAAGLAAALAPPPDDGGAQRKQREQNVLRRPGQFGKQVAEQANAGCGNAHPQQVAAGAEHFEDQEQGAEGQPVPECQVLQVLKHAY